MTVLLQPRTAIIDADHARVGAWMHANGAGRWREGVTCIGLERDGELVAAMMFDHYNGASIFAHIAITGRLSKDWVHRVCHYPFIQLGCQVVIGLVSEKNVASQRLAEHSGFVRGLAIPDADPSGALLIYTLTKDDCRVIRRPYYVI